MILRQGKMVLRHDKMILYQNKIVLHHCKKLVYRLEIGEWIKSVDVRFKPNRFLSITSLNKDITSLPFPFGGDLIP